MAFDKVVDSSVLEAGLTAIANAIREKGGTSDTLAFPDGMAEAIAAGGSESPFGEKSVCGTYTPASDMTLATDTTITIQHGLGETPHGFVFFRISYGNVVSGIACASSMAVYAAKDRELSDTYGGLHKVLRNDQYTFLKVASVDNESITFYCTEGAKVFSNLTYGWIALADRTVAQAT